MTVANRPASLVDQQHIVLDFVSWDFYERVLEELNNRPVRVTFDDGTIEIMAPLAEHEHSGRAIGVLVQVLGLELNIAMACYGSTTFRREDKQKGLEPDDCFYIANESRVRGMKDFDPKVHPPPDLAIEVDITRRSIARQPIYAALGVPELWRYDGKSFQVLLLRADGTFQPVESSMAFPFLPMREFERYVKRMQSEEQTAVLREFRDWVRTLSK